MNTFLQHIVKLLLLFSLLSLCDVVKCETPNLVYPDIGLVYKICSARTYPSDDDPYAKDEDSVTQQLAQVTATQGYNYYYQYGSCYGHAACDGYVPADDCTNCLGRARDSVHYFCGRSRGAQLQLVDCRMRIEDYPFQE